MKPPEKFVPHVYQVLLEFFGPQCWWPGETSFEVIIGAILTQNTNWSNVEKAINNLKKERLLSARALSELSEKKLARLIKPAGYFNVKAKRLKEFLRFFFENYDGKIEKMKKGALETLRGKLLSVNGIGPETADSILLYALDKRSFVVDAYTKRFLYRHNIVPKNIDYHEIKDLFEGSLKKSVKEYNEYHALIVRLGKEYCRPHPKCEQCPLNTINYSIMNRCSLCYRMISNKSHDSCSECKRIC